MKGLLYISQSYSPLECATDQKDGLTEKNIPGVTKQEECSRRCEKARTIKDFHLSVVWNIESDYWHVGQHLWVLPIPRVQPRQRGEGGQRGRRGCQGSRTRRCAKRETVWMTDNGLKTSIYETMKNPIHYHLSNSIRATSWLHLEQKLVYNLGMIWGQAKFYSEHAWKYPPKN